MSLISHLPSNFFIFQNNAVMRSPPTSMMQSGCFSPLDRSMGGTSPHKRGDESLNTSLGWICSLTAGMEPLENQDSITRDTVGGSSEYFERIDSVLKSPPGSPVLSRVFGHQTTNAIQQNAISPYESEAYDFTVVEESTPPPSPSLEKSAIAEGLDAPLAEKPPYSFPCLIGLALRSAQSVRRPLLLAISQHNKREERRRMFNPLISKNSSIVHSIQGRMSVSQIYDHITATFPYFRTAKNGWKNSVRHNLSLNKFFTKLERLSQEVGKGSMWGVAPGMQNQLDGDIAQVCSLKT